MRRLFRVIFAMAIGCAVVAACASAPRPATLVPTTAAGLPLLSATLPPLPTLTLSPTLSPTPLPSRTSTPSPSPTRTPQPPSPTITLTPTITPTLNPLREVPLTLMLHKSNESFDAVQFLKEFIPLVQQARYHVITYQDISRQPAITVIEEGRLFIFTIDDISLQAPINPSVQEMIALLQDAGYPAVLGVVTEGKLADPATVATLKNLLDQGWEIATHTDSHQNLKNLESLSPGEVYYEIQRSLDKIEQYFGVRPITLVLPEGDMVDNPRFIRKNAIQWVVGIRGGATYDATDHLVYVGRQGPYLDAPTTFRIMLQTTP